MPGQTAYFGLFRVGKPQPGETVVVSAASGAVGATVGQLAKAHGCRVIGVAGGPEKCAWCVEEAGFDACVDHPRVPGHRYWERCCHGVLALEARPLGGIFHPRYVYIRSSLA